MTAPRTAFAIHWTVGLVVLLESCRTFLGAHAGLHSAGHAVALASVRLALSGAEIVSALLFLVPVTTLFGGYALLAIFALAIAIHGLHGEFWGLEFLVVYGAAVFVSLADRSDRTVVPGSAPKAQSS